MASAANALINLIVSKCGGSYSSGNETCISVNDLTMFKYPIDAYTDITASVNSYTFLQCVGFVNTVTAGMFQQGLKEIDARGSAAAYASTNAPPGYVYVDKNSGTIKPGDIPVWTDNGVDSNGHIAIAISVLDSDHFVIAEANGFNGHVANTRNIQTSTEYGLAGWLEKL